MPIEQRPEPTSVTRERMLLLILVIVTLVVCLLALSLLLPFLAAITWAVVLTVVVHPLHAWLLRKRVRPWLAALTSVAIVTLAIAIPGFFLGRLVAHEALDSVDWIRAFLQNEPGRAWVEKWPFLEPFRDLIERFDWRGEIDRALEFVSKGARAFVAHLFDFVLGALITLYLLFYFLRDQRRMLAALYLSVPLAPREMDKILTDVRDTIHALVFGTIAVAVLQGALGGLMFWWLGLPSPLLWGTAMAVLAILPVMGAALVWAPAALYLTVQGEWHKAVLLAGWGAIIVSLIDNLVYPALVKNKMRLHTVPVFIALLGGLAVYGATGMVLGPLVLALAMALLEIWRRRFAAGEIESTAVDR